MKIGCFALMEPFSGMRRQFELIRSLGIDYADITDNHDGAELGGRIRLLVVLQSGRTPRGHSGHGPGVQPHVIGGLRARRSARSVEPGALRDFPDHQSR